ncbi:MAG: BatA domain-containing protein [Bacteroidia bacterium]|nr:BatA domain-containing protein [Bacteroidia bacterium]
MALLYPTFLWAFFALLIPIAIHLFNFRRFKKIEFSNVRLLSQIDRQTKSGNQLKKRLILASRLLAFSFLILAFCQPLLRSENWKNSIGKNSISIILDNTYSMNLNGDEGQLLEAAKNRARAIVNGASNADEFNIITSDLNAIFMHFRGKQATLENIDKIRLTAASRPLSDLLEVQNRLLKSKNGHKMGFCISDFQKKNTTISKTIIDSTVKKTWIKLESSQLDNISIDTCFLNSPIIQIGQNIGLVAQVSNYTKDKVEDLTLELWVDGKPKGIANFTINPYSNERQIINFTLESGGNHQCELKLPGDNIAIDDELYFSLNIKNDYHVLVISEEGERYADAVFSDNPGFIYLKENDGNINFSSFKKQELIILQGLNSIQSGLNSEIKKFVQNGGTVLAFPNKNSDVVTSGLKLLCSDFGINFSEQTDNTNTKVSYLELKHPIYQNVFENTPKNPDYPTVNKHYIVQANTGVSIAKLSNGHPFIHEINFGKGHFIICVSATDNAWGNFQNHALFPPTLIKSAMMGKYKSELYQICASNVPIFTGLPFEMESGISLISKKTSFVPEVINNNGEMTLNTNGEIESPGHYNLLIKNNDTAISSIAFNLSRNESDTRTLDDDEFSQICFENSISEFTGSSEKLSSEFNKNLKGTNLWKWCIIFVLFFLLIEILLIRFYKTNAKLPA